MKEIIGWILIVWGGIGLLYGLAVNPSLVPYELPAIALCIVGGWLLVRKKKKKEE